MYLVSTFAYAKVCESEHVLIGDNWLHGIKKKDRYVLEMTIH